jgi:hypothetical protein
MALVGLILVADWTHSRALALVIVVALGLVMLLRPFVRY